VEGALVRRTGAERPTVRAIATLACGLWPATAEAHLNSTGMGPLYDGLVHFVTSPEDLLAAFALALWAGLRSTAHGRRALFALPLAWLLGGLLGATASAMPAGQAVASAFSLLLLGGLLAADANLSPRATAILAACVGLQHGWANGAGMGSPLSAAVPLLGLDAAVFALVAVAAAFAAGLRAAWTRIAVRVAGSWIAAIGLLSLGWALRKG